MGQDETKCILFKKGNKQYPSLNISRNESKIEQYSVVEDLTCLENPWQKINEKTKFRYNQSRYLIIHHTL